MPGPQESAAARPVALVKRPDLIVLAQTIGGRTYWGLKDPLTLHYYHLRPEEYFVLQQLDGQTSAEQIREAFERAFAPCRLDARQLQIFCALLYREGLVTADAAGQGELLLQRRATVVRRQWLERFGNPLALRFRGLDPERLLGWLYPRVRWMFSPWTGAAWLLLVAAAALGVLVRCEAFRARLPDFAAFFRPENWLWFALVLAGCKILHELGHALTCKHFGGRCHELGLMLLVFTPCLYVNVSDAWMLPSKWQRIAISAAGMMVELGLAAGAAFAWWFSAPGLWNSLCLKVMFVGSVSTLVFNGNPLLRYDGYYLLSDLWEVPNLRQRADAALWQRLGRWVLGRDFTAPALYPERHGGLLSWYAAVSWLYRIAVVAAVLWFCQAALEPLGLQVLAQLLAVLTIAGLLAGPVVRAVRFWSLPGRSREVNSTRAAVTLGTCAVLVTAVLVMPWPHRVAAPAVFQLRGAERVFVPVAGRLTWAVAAGTTVRRGDVLGRLENPELALDIARLLGRRDTLRSQLQSLKSLTAQQISRGGGDAGAGLPTAEQALADVENRLRQREEEQRRLTLTAPAAGTVVPPRRQPETGPDSELPAWTDQPLDAANRNAWLETGTLFCLLGNPRSLEALLVIDQSEVGFVRPEQQVWLQCDQLPGRYVSGRIRELSQLGAEAVPPELVAARRLPLAEPASGQARLAGVFYQAKVTLADDACLPLPGAIGRARIVAAPLSLGSRLVRYLSSTFRLGP